MGKNPVANKLADWIVRRVWPWIVKFVWPAIRHQIVEIVRKAFDTLQGRIVAWIAARQASWDLQAEQRASEAEASADQAQSPAEAEKHRAIAQVWREVAEKFRLENEQLKTQIEAFLAASTEEISQSVAALPLIDFIEVGEHVPLQFSDGGAPLQLPGPIEEVRSELEPFDGDQADQQGDA